VTVELWKELLQDMMLIVLQSNGGDAVDLYLALPMEELSINNDGDVVVVFRCLNPTGRQ